MKRSIILPIALITTSLMLINTYKTTADDPNKAVNKTPSSSASCPALPELDAKPVVVIDTDTVYVHCIACRVGVYSAHEGESHRKCTFCGSAEPQLPAKGE